MNNVEGNDSRVNELLFAVVGGGLFTHLIKSISSKSWIGLDRSAGIILKRYWGCFFGI